ncbi:glycosyltransferase family 4 protein [Marinobacter orientalis]|uniref:Glycosyltransferase family 4 protein n=1 Tax=Marinobacter orientalis TaxID=1928859 RepID=A0A7Y0WTQ6_9GAMM|nr:glycosyltransferase family 4 protein [Marinobacter orientalis]NMT65228.1 glycosyltransferase family 4 protein [Marinobacter orientalis]
MAQSKKILFLVSSMQGGGAERVAALLCNYWAEAGHDIVLMPTFSGRGECLYPLDEKVRLEYLADRVGSTSKARWNGFRRLLALRHVMQEFRPDAVVSFLTHVNVAALIAATGLPFPVVVSERTNPALFQLSRFWALGRRLLYRRARSVVVQTSLVREWVEANCPGARIDVIPNPVVFPLPAGEPRISPATAVGGDHSVLLAVGRLGPEKGFDSLLDAFQGAAAENPGWNLVILGEGPERAALEQQVIDLGLSGRAHLPGRVGNLGDWYDRADLYALSSHFEGFPNTLVEAMAYGVPPVSMDCATGPVDIITPGKDGLLVAPETGTPGLEKALSTLMGDPVLRKSLATEAIDVRERFAIERVARQWSGVIGLEVE